MCKICRRMGEKLCGRAKCAAIRKPYPPGGRAKKRRRQSSTEYSKQLREKQKVKALYGLGERQFRRYVQHALTQRGKTIESLLSRLERRLDNVAYRLGFASSLPAARQLAAHGHFMVNGKRVTVPSYRVDPGDVIEVRSGSRERAPFREMQERLKKYTPPAWLGLEQERFRGEVRREPAPEDVGVLPANMQAILEYYSR